MQTELIKKTENELAFSIRNINPALANTLRRIMIAEVPTLAIEDVNFIKNDSALYDEVLAHRLGLIPLITDLKIYELKEECKCKGKGCAMCELKLILKAKGPCTVYASSLESKDPKVKPVFPETPITLLLKGQSLELEATAILGKGKNHAKFSPGIVYYKSLPIIDIDKDKTTQACISCVDVCPVDVFEMKDKKLTVKNIYNCILCRACEEKCPNKAVKVSSSDTDFIFYIEPFGQLKAKEILETSIEVFDRKLDEFGKKLKSVKKEK